VSLALAAAQRAVSLDRRNAGAHAILGTVLVSKGRHAAGDAELTAALEISPGHADAWLFARELRVYQGNAEDGIDLTRKAFRLKPLAPGWYHWYLGYAEYAAGRYEDAVRTLRHEATCQLASQRILAASLAQLGRVDEARREASHFLARYPNFSIRAWASTQAFVSDEDRQHFIDGYLKAGLPE
jgi:tetratricopeptide (TPR) repeat protein